MTKIQTQGVHHITFVGSNREAIIDFYQGVLGMPLVFEQPNLDVPDELHLYFDPGDGRLITHYQLDCALADVDGLTQYRLDQDAPAIVRCSVISQPGREGRVVSGVREALATLFGPSVALDVLEVSVLSPEPSGKFLLARRSFPLAEDTVAGVWKESHA